MTVVLPQQQLEGPAETASKIVGPLVLRSVNVDVAVDRDVKLPGRVLVGLDIGNVHLECRIRRRPVVDRHGEKGVGGNCHGKDRVEGVVDVFANDVHPAGRPRDKVGRVAMAALKDR